MLLLRKGELREFVACSVSFTVGLASIPLELNEKFQFAIDSTIYLLAEESQSCLRKKLYSINASNVFFFVVDNNDTFYFR